ncbi:RDD family protein [Angustibacter sp. McL0619]|uniref:RDD family protein n=1 Tax=Angustibacter sp. McL0619 TaxID=3415676 RepID=UPI003CF085EC
MDAMVTGDAVLLDVRPASFASRAVSGSIDLGTEVLVLLGLFVVMTQLVAGLDGAAAAALTLVVLIAVAVGVPVTIETLTRGRTLGKLIMGMRAVRDDGGPIRFRHALVRGLVGFVEIWVLWGVPALISSLVSPDGKRLGDLAAGTYVVRERPSRQVSVMATMPPQLAGWARHADIGRLPDGLALAVRQFLSRANGMHLAARADMAHSLADAVCEHVSPQPPPGTHPELVLAAVLAERRNRDVVRLAREQQQRYRLAGTNSVEAALARVHRP